MNAQTAAARLYYRAARPEWDKCSICGCASRQTSENPFPKHDAPVHEVFAFERWGMHSVAYPARPFVEAWASGSEPLPSDEEYRRLLEVSSV